MFGSEILDVALGLALVYLLVSLICSALRETAEGWFKTRAVYLEQGIRQLLRDPKLVENLYQHPLVYALFRGEYVPPTGADRHWYNRTNLPAYIPAANFASALLDLAVRGKNVAEEPKAAADSPAISLENIRKSIASLGQAQVQRALLTAIDRANGDLEKAHANVEAWYNSAMDRVSGWYKRRTQVYLLITGAAIAVWLNVNTLTIARYLYQDQSTRSALVSSAAEISRDPSIKGAPLDTLLNRAKRLGLPVGWRYGLSGTRAEDAALTSEEPMPPLLWAILGWLMTAVAVSLGAPFWFDLLNKFMVVRSTVKPHEKSSEEASEDRQPRPVRSAGRGGATP